MYNAWMRIAGGEKKRWFQEIGFVKFLVRGVGPGAEES